MVFILLMSSVFLCVKAENGYGYEVEVVPLQDPSEEAKPFSATPTGGYTFLGFGANNAVGPNSNANPAIDKGQAPEMRLGLNTVPSENRGNGHVMDLVLVLDSSYSITSKGWMKLKKAAKKLIDGLDISPQGTHVAIMKFSTDVEAYYMFDPKATKEKLKQLLDDLEFDGEWSRMDLALKSVDRHALAPIDGARPGNVPKAVVIFSDGKSDGPTPPEEEIDWQARVAEPLKSLRKKNVDIFSVAAGVPDKRALAAIAGSPARVFDINSVNNLATAIKEESIPIPPAASPPMPVPSLPLPPLPPPPPPPPSSPPPPPPTSALIPTTSTVLGTCTAIQTVTMTTVVATTPVTIVVATETQTSFLTAVKTASTLVVTATKTDTVTETVTATATQSLTSTAMDTATSTVIATATAVEVVTLTTTVKVTSTTYAKASATPIPITIMGAVQGKKKNKIIRVKRWYEDYLPTTVMKWMAIKD